MTKGEPIPEDVRRFVLTSITSVPQLEAILLLRSDAKHSWDGKHVAQRLYVSEKLADQLLTDLCAAGVLVVTGQENLLYRYQPSSDELMQMIDRVATVYSKNIVAMTNLIHSETSKKAQKFADAFKLRGDS
ncbi:MAG: hypothetical protein HY308_11805 [Gammaproteobacteria bacterium]|nr:hypothetical protein [Gammaproteobacteria bacterium]